MMDLFSPTAAFVLLCLPVLLYVRWRLSDSRPPRNPIESSKLPHNFSKASGFDYVIIGGGTAGCVLASGLSEDPESTVLLLEGGKSGVAISDTRIPLAWPTLLGRPDTDWGLKTTCQSGLNGRSLPFPRGKMLGGCSSINAMMFHQGSASDFDGWELEPRTYAHWRYSSLRRYFKKFESFAHDSSFPVDSSQRGQKGLVSTGFFGHYSKISSCLIKAAVACGISFTRDFNTAGNGLGTNRIMTFIDQFGRRVSTETAYLTPEVLNRANLTVVTKAHVTQITIDEISKQPRATGVVFRAGRNAVSHYARARKEVILSAGAIHSPQILMLSGVGPAEQLSQLGIPIVANLPVGANLMDHVCLATRFRARPGLGLNYDATSLLGIFSRLSQYIQWLLYGTGPLSSNCAESVAFYSSTDPVLFPEPPFSQTHCGRGTSPDLETISVPFFAHHDGPPPPGEFFTLITVLLRPTSSGSVTLQSNDPFDPPIIDPKYLTTPRDMEALRRGLRMALRLSREHPLASCLIPGHSMCDDGLAAASDEELEEVIRSRAMTIYHPTSTLRMAPLSQGGVVDENLCVHGIQGLRVVDASIFPAITSGHTAAPTIAVAELAADLIKGIDGLKPMPPSFPSNLVR